MVFKKIKAWMDEKGGIGIEVDKISHTLPFCPKCKTPALIQDFGTNRLYCLKCGSVFKVEFEEDSYDFPSSKKSGEKAKNQT